RREMRRAGVVVPDRRPVLARPARVGDARVADALLVLAFHLHRNGEPAEPARRLDQVAAAPVALGELHVVEQDELVDLVDEIEIALPRDVARLQDRDALQGFSFYNPPQRWLRIADNAARLAGRAPG